MTNNKQQTAVEQFLNAIKDQILLSKEHIEMIESYADQCKEIEKEQIAKAFDDGDYNYHYSRKTGNDFEDGKEYFNEVYG
jgi:hypothetical protein